MEWKDLLYFNKRERKGIIILLILIFIGIITTFIYDNSLKSRDNSLAHNTALDTDTLLNNIVLPDSKQSNTTLETPLTKSICDPNTASIEELKQAGIPKYIAQNIINYRKKGGRFKNVSDLRKLYTMTDSVYAKISPWIDIKTPKNTVSIKKVYQPNKYKHRYTNNKFKKDTLININHCDTTTLKRIPQIGSYTARKIVRYRERLGGYISINQLYEIGIDSILVKRWFQVDSDTEIQTFDINTLEFSELLRHPYLEYEEVKAIFNYKRKHGNLKSIKELQFIEPFDSVKVKRLSSYLRFS